MPYVSDDRDQDDNSYSLQGLREKILLHTMQVLAIVMPAISASNILQSYLNGELTFGYTMRGLWTLIFILLYALHKRLGYRASSTLLIGLLVVTASLIASRGTIASGTVLLSALAINLAALFFTRKGSLLTFFALIVGLALAAYMIVSGTVAAPNSEQLNLLSPNFWMRQLIIFLGIGLALLIAQVYVIEYLVKLYTGYREQVLVEQQQRLELEIAEQARDQEQALRLKAQKELDDVKRTEALSRMAGSIAHDFNNTLTVIMGNAELCLKRSKEEATRKNLTHILNASANASRLVQQLMTLGRRHLSEPKMVPMSSTLKNYLSAIKQVLPADIGISLDIKQECIA